MNDRAGIQHVIGLRDLPVFSVIMLYVLSQRPSGINAN